MESIYSDGEPQLNQTLYLEIGSLFLFLAMVVKTQVERAGVPGYYSRNPRLQIRWLSIVFVALSVGFGSVLFSVSPLLALALATGFTLSLIHPANALCLFVLMLFLRPWEILTTNPVLLALPRLLALACFISWLLYQGKCGKPTVRTMRPVLLLLGFSFWLFLTTFRAHDMAVAHMEWLNTFFKAVIVFLMCLVFIEDERSVQELKRTLVISSFALILLSFYRYFFQPPEAEAGGRLHLAGMLGDSNDLAACVIIALPLGIGPLFKRSASGVQRIGGILFSALSLAAIWYSQSRGAMLAFLTQVFAFGSLFKAQGRRVRMLLMIAFLGLTYVLALHVLSRSTQEMSISQESRLIYWKAAVNMTLHHPIWGVGFGQYPANYEAFASTVKYEWGVRTAHSSWLLAFAESGLIGGFLFIAFFVTVLRIAWEHLRDNPDLFYALVGYIVAMSFLSHTYMLSPYLLSGLILAASAVKERAANGL